MATFVAKTDWVHPKSGGTSFSVTLSHTATAGNKLVFFSGGGAISTPTGFTELTTYGGGTEDVSIWDKTAAGGETSVSVSLNGSGDNVGGTILEFGPGLTFSAWSNNGTGNVAQQSNDYQILPSSAVSLSSGNGVLVSIHTAATSVAWSLANSMRSYGPLGSLISVGGNVDASGTEFFNYGIGIADVTSTGSYPATAAAGHYTATTNYTPGSGRCYAAQVLYTDTSGVATVAPSTKTAQENSLPGTVYQNWFLGDNGTDSTTAAYTDFCSYNPGDTVNFKVNSSNNPFRVEIYRLGFYSYETFGARNVLGNQAGYITGTAMVQPTPTTDSTLGSVSCGWTTNATWAIPSTAQSGVYYYFVRRTDVTTHVASGHFVVKAASVTNKMVVVIPDQTHQAYNRWGAITDTGTTMTGRSLYASGADGGTWVFTDRAYAVSFDRPYGLQADRDVTYLFDSTMSFISFAEAQGYEMCYVSDMDLHASPTICQGAAMVVLAGHQEYWTTNTYNAMYNIVNNYGINVVNLSANTALWHTRFASADTNYRTMICYKESGTLDVGPNGALPGTGYDPVSYTGTWRDTRQLSGTVNNVDIRRENFLGQIFVISGHFSGQAVIDAAHKTSPIWRNSAGVQALTTGQTYTCPITSIGDETDYPDGSSGQPANMVMLFSQPGVTSSLGANAAGTLYSSSVTVTLGWTLAQTSGGSLIFSTGNWRGHNPISRWRTASTAPSTGGIDLNWQNALLCILYDMGQTPVTLTAMQPGTDTAVTDPAMGGMGQGKTTVGKAYGLLEPTPKVAFMYSQAVNRSATY
jgi:hypothetical protein